MRNSNAEAGAQVNEWAGSIVELSDCEGDDERCSR
jgi:hypothetical protein